MSIAGSQQRTFLALLAALRPHWRTDRNLPARLQSLLAANRAFGSRDRRLYRELVYTTLRYLPWIEPFLEADPDRATRLAAWLAADAPATERFRTALIAGWPACPPTLAAKAQLLNHDAAFGPAPAPFRGDDLLPAWFRKHCPAAFAPAELDAQLTRAPLWLRLQTSDPAPVLAEFTALGWRCEPAPDLPSALRLFGEVDVTKTKAFADGLVEVQDLGSQLLLASAGLAPGERWLDACAGAGGKTLQLAQQLGASGYVHAHDIRPAALTELATRAARARLRTITVLRQPPVATYDGVLVDAPCSGSGTWRRAPHLKWTTTPAQIASAAALQLELLAKFSACVRPGGRVLYATCSLSQRENEEVVAAFLAAHGDFHLEPPAQTFGADPTDRGLTILPSRHNTDGFFAAHLRRA